MQLSELLYQRVKEMGERGQLVLKPGYCVVVGKSRSLKHVLLGALFQNPDDQLAHFPHLRLTKAARGNRRRADSNAARHEGRLSLLRHGVLVHRDRRPAERRFAQFCQDRLARRGGEIL